MARVHRGAGGAQARQRELRLRRTRHDGGGLRGECALHCGSARRPRPLARRSSARSRRSHARGDGLQHQPGNRAPVRAARTRGARFGSGLPLAGRTRPGPGDGGRRGHGAGIRGDPAGESGGAGRERTSRCPATRRGAASRGDARGPESRPRGAPVRLPIRGRIRPRTRGARAEPGAVAGTAGGGGALPRVSRKLQGLSHRA